MVDNVPTPEEIEEARKACGPTAPLNVLMGWVLQSRRAAQSDNISGIFEQLFNEGKK
jgi:hypothetical protein